MHMFWPPVSLATASGGSPMVRLKIVADLPETPISDALHKAAPFAATANSWGDEV